MSSVVEDFIKCAKNRDCGFFKGDRIAADYAKDLSVNQLKKWRERRQVPAAFLHYLVAVGAISRKFVPERERTVLKILELLHRDPARNVERPSIGEKILKVLFTELLGEKWVNHLTGSTDFIRKKIELFGLKRR